MHPSRRHPLHLLAIASVWLFSAPAHADRERRLSPEAGLGAGFVSNALLSDLDPRADLYATGRAGLRWRTPAAAAGSAQSGAFFVNYEDFVRFDSRDLLALQARYRRERVTGEWALVLGVTHSNYLRTSPGYSDFAFDSLGGTAALERDFTLNRDFAGSAAFAYAFRKYTEGSRRIDHTLLADGELRTDLGSGGSNELSFSGDLAIVQSNESAFHSRTLGLNLNYWQELAPKHSLDAGLDLARTIYPDRTVNTLTITRVRRRATQTSVIEEKETKGYFRLYGVYRYELSPAFTLRADLSVARQTSRSGAENYGVWAMAGGISWRL